MTELEKYQGIYGSVNFSQYGHACHGARAVPIIARWQPKRVIDVGCGHNEFAQRLRQALPDTSVIGADFACTSADLICWAHEIPGPDKSFDVVTAFDVLEHLPPEDVDRTLTELARISERFCVSISYVDSKNRWQGQTLHPTVRPEGWWIQRLMRAGAVEIKVEGRYIHGRWIKPLRIAKDARVVLVGNGPSILAEELGEEIDRFDEVIRFNNFVTGGFGKHTGSKTTLWSCYVRGSQLPAKHARVILPHENDRPTDDMTEVYRIPAWQFARVRKLTQDRALWASGHRRNVEPLLASSGLQMAAFLLDVVGVEKLAIAGFDHFSKARSSQHHYWLKQAFAQPKEHHCETEAAMFDELRKAGRIFNLGTV
ncbi:MAG: methyltransferase domain-containing protein [Caulobacteraceae bacterium]|nr:methyltransferase domain-containing protein [Caulobacteraceae bacterium]